MRETFKMVCLQFSDSTVISYKIYPWLEFKFNNRYITSKYITLTGTGYRFNSSASKVLRILPSIHDSLDGKSTLLLHLMVILAGTVLFMAIVYVWLQSQLVSKTKVGQQGQGQEGMALDMPDETDSDLVSSDVSEQKGTFELAGPPHPRK